MAIRPVVPADHLVRHRLHPKSLLSIRRDDAQTGSSQQTLDDGVAGNARTGAARVPFGSIAPVSDVRVMTGSTALQRFADFSRT